MGNIFYLLITLNSDFEKNKIIGVCKVGTLPKETNNWGEIILERISDNIVKFLIQNYSNEVEVATCIHKNTFKLTDVSPIELKGYVTIDEHTIELTLSEIEVLN